MIISPQQQGLLMRFSNYKRYSFIDELNRSIMKVGSGWFLKTGKTIPQAKLQPIIQNGGFFILKAPKADGDDYYIAHITESFNGSPKSEMIYPSYYDDMVEDDNLWMMDSLEGTWLKTDYVGRMRIEDIKHLYLCSNKKPADVVAHSTRSSTMYIYSDIELSYE